MKGFLGYQPLFMIDLVLVAQVIVLPLLGVAIYMAKKGKYKIHSRLMMILTVVLLIAVFAFEIEIRLHGGIEEIARMAGTLENVQAPLFRWTFFTHLLFCGLVTPLWIFVIFRAIQKLGWKEPAPTAYGPYHKKWAILSLVGAFFVGTTGVAVYFLAFAV